VHKHYMPKKWQKRINVDTSNKIKIKPKSELPLTIWLSDTSDVLVRQNILRTIPNKRWVTTATWGEQDVVAKIFTTAKHAQRELQGFEILKAAGIRTPELLYHGWAVKQPYYILIFERVEQVQDIDQLWWSAQQHQRDEILHSLILLTAKMHQAGIKQNDLHLKNFLLSNNNIYVVDTSDISQTNNQSLSKQEYLKNLAILFAQIAPSYDESCNDWYLLYVKERHLVFTLRDVTRLKKWIIYKRRQHLKTYSRKIFRTTSHLICHKTWRKFTVCDRQYAVPELEDLLQNPEAFMSEENNSQVQMLKRGNTCTVARVKIGNHDLVIKRYNIKNFWHGIKRAFRATRAAICWRNAMGLASWRLGVSKPVALIEKRFGPLRSTAYFISEYISGTNLQDFCKDDDVDDKAALQTVAHRVAQLFADLSAIKMTHGDLKANNILLDNGTPILVDLDAMRMHRCAWQWRRAKLKDERRFAKNWQGRPEIAKVFARS
jgi:tRNA A-37 threonylcarbamoyl transferase component Bud32